MSKLLVYIAILASLLLGGGVPLGQLAARRLSPSRPWLKPGNNWGQGFSVKNRGSGGSYYTGGGRLGSVLSGGGGYGRLSGYGQNRPQNKWGTGFINAGFKNLGPSTKDIRLFGRSSDIDMTFNKKPQIEPGFNGGWKPANPWTKPGKGATKPAFKPGVVPTKTAYASAGGGSTKSAFKPWLTKDLVSSNQNSFARPFKRPKFNNFPFDNSFTKTVRPKTSFKRLPYMSGYDDKGGVMYCRPTAANNYCSSLKGKMPMSTWDDAKFINEGSFVQKYPHLRSGDFRGKRREFQFVG